MPTNPATTYADGAIPWDSFTAGIIPTSTTPGSTTPGSTIFIFESFDPNEPSTFNVSGDQQMVPRGGKDIAGVTTYTATLQFPAGAATSVAPNRFDSFIHPNYRGATKYFLITEVGLPQRAGQETKMSIKGREVLNPPGSTGPVV